MKFQEGLEKIKEKLNKFKKGNSVSTEVEPEKLEKLLNSSIPDDCIVKLKKSVRGEDGSILYNIYDYFLCDTPRDNMKMNEEHLAIKISGENIGRKYNLYIIHTSCLDSFYSESHIVLDENGVRWQGDVRTNPNIPEECRTIGDLNDYMNEKNAIEINNHQQQNPYVAREEKIRDMFFK